MTFLQLLLQLNKRMKFLMADFATLTTNVATLRDAFEAFKTASGDEKALVAAAAAAQKTSDDAAAAAADTASQATIDSLNAEVVALTAEIEAATPAPADPAPSA